MPPEPPPPAPDSSAAARDPSVAARLRQRAAEQPVVAAAAVSAVLVAVMLVGGVVVGLAGRLAADEPLAGLWRAAAAPTPSPQAPASEAPGPVRLSATGDIIMGDAGALPPRDGDGFFDGVAEALVADLVMGNLEQPLTGDTGYRKCGEDSEGCHAFRAPPSYASHLAEAGFDLLNLANNHGNDFGAQGRVNTMEALDREGLAYTGQRDQITVLPAGEVEVAVVGFSPYEWTNDLNDLDQAAGVVSEAARRAELVVVQVHMGAEGSDATRVRPGPETFFGEPRGDPMAFARAVIDAGADLVVGHGPHVLRGLEFYRGRLIAYSLGNFAGGGGTLSTAGDLGLGAVLKVSLLPDGEFAGGQLVSTHMYDAGLPQVDPQRRSLQLVQRLTERDFPETGAQLGSDGEIRPPPG